MKLAQAMSVSTPSAFEEVVADNVGNWFRTFLRITPLSRSNIRDNVLPFGRFSRVLRKAMVVHRGKQGTGVATGQWLMPSGLTAAQAWKHIHHHLNRLSVALLLEGMMDSTPRMAFNVVPVMRFATSTAPRPQRKELFSTPVPVTDPLLGLNRTRLKYRLRKAWDKGTMYVHMFTTDLTRLLDKLPEYEEVEPARLAVAMADIGYILGLAERAVAWRTRLTPEQVEANARAEQRHEAKLTKKVERRERRKLNKVVKANLREPDTNVVVLRVRKATVARKAAEPVQNVTAQADVVISLEEVQQKYWFRLSTVRRLKRKTSGATQKASRRRKANYFARQTAAQQLTLAA